MKRARTSRAIEMAEKALNRTVRWLNSQATKSSLGLLSNLRVYLTLSSSSRYPLVSILLPYSIEACTVAASNLTPCSSFGSSFLKKPCRVCRVDFADCSRAYSEEASCCTCSKMSCSRQTSRFLGLEAAAGCPFSTASLESKAQ